MKHLIALLLLLCTATAPAQTSTTDWIPAPVDAAASGSSTQTLCEAAVKKLYGASQTCAKRIKTSPAPITTWAKIADEGGSFTVGTSVRVRYGANATWVEKTLTGAGQCTNEFFGGDPLQGVAKQCQSTAAAPIVGSAVVGWVAPTTKADGTPLTDLAGYRVQYGPATGLYTASVSASADALSAVVPGLSAGAWFFAVRATNTSGVESTSSTEVSKVVQ